jgi:hypothetical protein
MQDDNFILDENLDGKTQVKLPNAIVSFEWIFFLMLILSQYLAGLQMITASGYDGFLGLLWGGAVHILLGFWQFLSGLIIWVDKRDQLRKIYLILASVTLLVLTSVFLGLMREELIAGLFLVISHGLAWFYFYIVFRDSRIRKKALSGL